MAQLNYLMGHNHLKVYQNQKVFKYSLDSILLPNFVTLNLRAKKILDIGCGNGVISLILSTKTKASITAVEIQKEVFDLALKSIKENKLEEQIELVNADILELSQKWESDKFDVIVCNPPFFKMNEEIKISNNELKAKARHELTLKLEDIFKISRKLLKNNGVLALVNRPERLGEIISLMKKYNLQPKRMQFVYPRIKQKANILLIEGRKNGKEGLVVETPLIIYKDNVEYTQIFKKYIEGGKDE